MSVLQHDIGMVKHQGSFICPICGCEFRHNFRKWLIGLPLALVVTAALWLIFPHPTIKIAFLVPVVTGVAVMRIPTYSIITEGREVKSTDLVEAPARPKESRWFLVVLGLLVAVILTLLAYSIFSSIR